MYCIVSLTAVSCLLQKTPFFFNLQRYCCLEIEDWTLKVGWKFAIRGLVAYKVVAYKNRIAEDFQIAFNTIHYYASCFHCFLFKKGMFCFSFYPNMIRFLRTTAFPIVWILLIENDARFKMNTQRCDLYLNTPLSSEAATKGVL